MDFEPVNVNSLLLIVNSTQLPQKRPSKGYLVPRFKEPPCADFLCKVCERVVRKPMECESCGVLYCGRCIPRSAMQVPFLSRRLNRIFCSSCQTTGLPRQPSPLLKRMIGALEICCKYTACAVAVPLSAIKAHERSCGFQEVICANSTECNQRGLLKEFVLLRKEGPAHIMKAHFISRFACCERCRQLVEFDRMAKKKDRQGVLRAYRRLLRSLNELSCELI